MLHQFALGCGSTRDALVRNSSNLGTSGRQHTARPTV